MKKRIVIIGLLLALVGVLAAATALAAPQANGGGACTTIPSGELLTSGGDVITPGYDQYGYNYQAHMFNGRYCDYDRVIGGSYCDVDLVMKWNDAWLSNASCDDDGLLDRHYGYPTYGGSGAWVTNHQKGTDILGDGQICEWDYFVKIVAAPTDATASGGIWYSADGTEIGPAIWGAFAIIQEVYNDPCGGYQGLLYRSPHHPGLGGW
jgi:hypothetical protein